MASDGLIESELLYDGKVVHLRRDRVRLPGGQEVDLEVVRHQGAAAILPLNAAGEVILIRQYRWATGGWILEVPAGKIDAGEPPETCARRELEEETGYRAKRWSPLGWIWTTPGFTDEKIWLYLAEDLLETESNLDHDEVLEVVRMPLEEAVEKVYRGEIPDSKSITLILKAQNYLGF